MAKLPQDVLIILFDEETPWDSCRDINEGLLSFYKLIFPNLTIFYSSDDPQSGLRLKETIQSKNYSKIIFLDHRIRIPKELHYICQSNLKIDLSKIHFIFHVYGCFLGRMSEWRFITEKLSFARVDFVVGSEAQAGVVTKCLDLKTQPIVIPFPVKMDQLIESSHVKKEDLGIDRFANVALYVGRVSPGKNIIPLCQVIADLNDKSETHLIIIGSIDDFGWPKNSKWPNRGAMCNLFAQKMTSINKSKKIIHYIPFIEDKKQLYGYYNMADVFVSLSTMLNEDYGMAIADAIGLDKKIVCTRWGGYKSFGLKEKFIDLVDVHINNGNIQFSLEDVKNKISSSFKKEDVVYHKQLSYEDIYKNFDKDLFEQESGINGLKKLGKTISMFSLYQVINNDSSKDVYDSFWI